jgi:hypothetical protein
MGNYAKVSEGRVTQVIVAEPEFFQSFLDTSPGEWIQTSFNTRGGVHYKPNSYEPSEDQSKALRKNFAGLGYTYDKTRDAFIPPKPYPSWSLNEDTCLWDPPVPFPNDGLGYLWNEADGIWEQVSEPE